MAKNGLVIKVKFKVAFWVRPAVLMQGVLLRLFNKPMQSEPKIFKRDFVRPGKTVLWVYWIRII